MKYKLRNIKLTLKFDGTNYHGWQIQENAVTIQYLIQRAIKKVTGEDVNVVGCGRTDSGVHAFGYICNFKTESLIPVEKFPLAINSYLPEDVVCYKAEEVCDDFHSAYSSKKKRYTYFISNGEFPDVFSHSWHYKYPLDIEKMKKAGECFLGTHDFIGFAAAGFTVKTTVRTIYSLDIEKDGDMIRIDITGNGFLYNMVRIIAGTLCFVGSGKIDYKDMDAIIESKDRTKAGITAPAEGLFLSEVYYED